MTERNSTSPLRVAFIGFGEAASAFVSGWKQDGIAPYVRAYDLKTDSPDTAQTQWGRYSDATVSGQETLADALEGAEVIFSMVTADQAASAAQAAAACIPRGATFFDCNSCAPDTKRASAQAIETAGATYIDTAVMSPVHPKLNKTPLLLGAANTDKAVKIAEMLGLSATVASSEIGKASSIKMMRSVMIKGLEALTLECLLSARKAGVDAEVIASLDASFPDWDWASRAGYNFERTTTHGIRRAAEMREVAKTVSDLGLNNTMSHAIVDWQQSMGDLGLDLTDPDFVTRADTILKTLEE